MTSLTVEAVIAAPRDVVYRVFADRESYGVVPGMSTSLHTPGQTERQGVGAVHQLQLGPVRIHEQFTELVPGERISYQAVSGLPVRNHTGTIELSDVGSGTKVSYTVDSTPKIAAPKPLVSLLIRGLVLVIVANARRKATRTQG